MPLAMTRVVTGITAAFTTAALITAADNVTFVTITSTAHVVSLPAAIFIFTVVSTISVAALNQQQ